MTESLPQKTSYPAAESADVFVRTNNFSKPLVLIVEQDDESRCMLRTLLEMWNYRVLEAKNDEEAVCLVRENCPNLILIDITLQYMNTLASLRRLRRIAQCGETPIIFLSGHAQPALRDLALAFGANDLLVKPVDYDLLRKTLRRQSRKNKKRSGEIFGGVYR